MAEEALAAHPEFQRSSPEFQLSISGSPAAAAAEAENPNRPSIGIMSFSGEIFDGTALTYGEGKAYSKLKRCVPQLGLCREPAARALTRVAVCAGRSRRCSAW